MMYNKRLAFACEAGICIAIGMVYALMHDAAGVFGDFRGANSGLHERQRPFPKGQEGTMKKRLMAVMMGLVVLAGIAGIAATASAEDAKIGSMTLDELKSALGMSAYVQVGYTYNANPTTDPGTGSKENDLRWFDHKAKSFQLDLAELVFLKDPALGTAGYKVKIAAGETAQLIHAVGMGDAGSDSFDITEAYISYIAKIGSGLRFDIGKMGTFIGAEVMEAKDNPNYSRSFLFNYAEPLTHTGVKVGYSPAEVLSIAVLALNGWDNASDNNTAKSYGLSIGITPAEMFSASLNLITGAEQNDNSRDKRTLADIVATITPVKPLTIILNYDNGKEEKVIAGADAKWSGLSAVAKYDINETYSLAVRGEYFDDKDGYRTGTVQKMKEVTVTPEIRLDGGLIVRPEYRHDISDKQSFNDGTKKKQDTIALGVMYTW